MKSYFPSSSDQPSWLAALLSLLPLFIAGPGRIIVFYTSGFGSSQEAWYFFPYLGLVCLVCLLSLAIGALRGFPRWAYPYPLTLVFALTDLYSTYTYHNGWITLGQNSCFGILALVALLLCLPGLHVFYQKIRQDWTLLTYGLFGFVLFLLAQFDRDEYPLLSPGVLLPSLIGLGAALAQLRIRQAPVRVLALIAGTLVGLVFWWRGVFTGSISIFIGIAFGGGLVLAFWIILSAILLSPLLVILLREARFAKK